MAKYNSIITIVQTLQRHDLLAFNSRTLADLLGLNKVQASHLLKRMQKENLVTRVEAGKYLLLGLSPEQVLSNPFYIGCHLFSPVYVSFWSALHFHGFTEQVPRTVFLATTRNKQVLTFQQINFKFVRLPPAAFFGYRRELHAGLPVLMADEAKAIIDSLILPQYAGGLAEVVKALRYACRQENESLDIPTLIEYANYLSSPSLNARLGFLLDTLGKSTRGLEIWHGPVSLDAHKPRRGVYNSRWRLIVNVPLTTIFPEGAV
jgi:predicted transcriptional regulator of viral defense system